MVPISVLLQVVALTIGDETELRRVQSEDGVDLEAESRPIAALALTYPKLKLGAGYSPTLFAGPLESGERRFEALHAIFADGDISFGSGRQTLTFTVSGSGEQRNPRREALSTLRGTDTGVGGSPTTSGQLGAPGAAGAPGAPGTTTSTGTSAVTGALLGSDTIVPGTVRTVRARGAARFRHAFTPVSGFSVESGYEVSGGLDDASRDSYPLMHGPNASLGLDTALSRRDSLTSTLNGSMSTSERNRAWLANLTEQLSHAFTRSTTGSLAAGVAYYRNEPPDAPADSGFTPTAAAAIGSITMLAKGKLDSRVSVDYTPVIDPQTTELDPRFRTLASLMWTRAELALALRSEGMLSGNPGGSNELQAIRAEAVLGYDLGSGFTAQAGARGAWQRARGVETLPPSSVLFVALSWFATAEQK